MSLERGLRRSDVVRYSLLRRRGRCTLSGMTATITGSAANVVPLPPKNPLPYWRRLTATRRWFAGRMVEAAELLADRWAVGATVDLDADCRAMTLRALCHSILGIDLGYRPEVLGTALRTSIKWAADRGSRPINPPRWWPTRGQRRARAAGAALHTLAAQMLHVCRADPTRDAPLVRTLLKTIDPQTGQPLSDRAICDELVLFLLAGHDTTSTALTYALWALGHQPDLQQRVAAEAAALGGRRLTHEDVPQLPYTVQVLHEALRLCPPAPAVGRMVMADIEVDGYRLPAGTVALVRDLRHTSRPCVMGRSAALRPRPIQPATLPGTRPLAIPAVRWRPARMHRRSFRDARGNPRLGDNSSAGGSRFTEPRFPHHYPADDDRRRPDPSQRRAARGLVELRVNRSKWRVP